MIVTPEQIAAECAKRYDVNTQAIYDVPIKAVMKLESNAFTAGAEFVMAQLQEAFNSNRDGFIVTNCLRNLTVEQMATVANQLFKRLPKNMRL